MRIETSGPDERGYTWIRDGMSGAPVFHRGVDVFLSCDLEPKAKSCAIQGRGDGLCHIYLPPEPEPWMEPHEVRHCAGWRHPDWTQGKFRP